LAPGLFLGKVGYTRRELSEELIARRAAEEELFGVTV